MLIFRFYKDLKLYEIKTSKKWNFSNNSKFLISSQNYFTKIFDENFKTFIFGFMTQYQKQIKKKMSSRENFTDFSKFLFHTLGKTIECWEKLHIKSTN